MIAKLTAVLDRIEQNAAVAFLGRLMKRYRQDGGSWLAAVISYYGFLSLLPLILLGIAVLGAFIARDADSRLEWTIRLVHYFPGLGDEIGPSLNSIANRSTRFGIAGLAGLAWTGMRAMESSSYALSVVFRRTTHESTLRQKGRAVFSTLVIGAAALGGIVLSAFVGSWELAQPFGFVTRALGVLVSMSADFLVFLVAYRLLIPKPGPRFAQLWQGTLFAAGGWTALKVFGSWYVAQQTRASGGTYGTLAAVVALLALFFLAARLFLFGAELNAVLGEERGDLDPHEQPKQETGPEVAKKS